MAAAACLLACAASAGAAARQGSGTDPSGDGAGPSRDVTALSASYDPAAGAISAQVTRIRLSFADGTVSLRTIGIEQPAAKGLLLDDTNFYPDSD